MTEFVDPSATTFADFSDTAKTIPTKFYWKPPLFKEKKICLGCSWLTNMATRGGIPISAKIEDFILRDHGIENKNVLILPFVSQDGQHRRYLKILFLPNQ